MSTSITMIRSAAVQGVHRAAGVSYVETDDAAAAQLIRLGMAFENGYTRGLEIRFKNDGSGRLSQILNGEVPVANFNYDGGGNLISIIAAGKTITFQESGGVTEGVNLV